MECPKCGSEIASSRSCGCGWKARSSRDIAGEVHPEGYKPCEWTSGDEQCRYPASIDRRWCTGHYGCDPHMGGYVVEASRDYVHKTAAQRTAEDIARLNAEAHAFCVANGLTRRPDESVKAFLARRRAWLREKTMGVARRAA